MQVNYKIALTAAAVQMHSFSECQMTHHPSNTYKRINIPYIIDSCTAYDYKSMQCLSLSIIVAENIHIHMQCMTQSQ